LRVDIANVNRFIEVNDCPKVTNPISLDMTRYPTSDGLFSYELFGLPGSYDRKTIFGYVDLKKNFLHPIVYKLLISMSKKIAYLIEGSKYFRIENGELVEDSENGQTGIDFLYDNWEKLIFTESDSRIRSDKIALLKNLSKDELFCNKFLVIPPFYRDINFDKISSGKISVGDLNKFYVKLISLASSIRDNMGFDFMGNITENKIQLLLVDIYVYLTSKLAKKNGYIRKNLLGKTVDYAFRSVISAPRMTSETYKTAQAKFTEAGIPLAQACNLFFPFMVKEIQDFLEEEFTAVNFIYVLSKGEKLDINNLKKVYLKNPMDAYSMDNIKKLISLFIKSHENRFDRLFVNTEDGEKPLTFYYQDLGRVFTLTDLLYISAHKICMDKHVYITRYPIETHSNVYPSKIHLLSTYNTKQQRLGNKWFEEYPDIYLEYPMEKNPFTDTCVLANSYMKALGGDYDGDMISIRGVFSQEANKEANDLIYSTKNLLDTTGSNMRILQKESIMSLYGLTKD